MTEDELILRTFELAKKARSQGNHPFGALLADKSGTIVLEAENTVCTSGDNTSHAELNLIREAARKFGSNIKGISLYSSAEPCPMCASAAFWAGFKRIVYGLSRTRLEEIIAETNDKSILALNLDCRDLFSCASHDVDIVGPLFSDIAVEVHRDYWGG